jgi:hypothetical protein
MMVLTTSLAGRVRNTSLPESHSLLPLLEAVVNGLQAIDARFGEDGEAPESFTDTGAAVHLDGFKDACRGGCQTGASSR